eukprot:GABV01007559.1.p1 GENE.GABV01007559.1~~GABV01007559.1.p1  ORF type:complete len:106 (-),score=40.92 GABV01007559.1:3-320(-)
MSKPRPSTTTFIVALLFLFQGFFVLQDWRLRLNNFQPESKLNEQLTILDSLYGVNDVEIDIKFPMDLFPFYPPTIRLVRPRLENMLFSRIVLMDELRLDKWRLDA